MVESLLALETCTPTSLENCLSRRDCLTIPKREAVDGPGFDVEFCLLAELAGLELLAEIPVVTPTDLGALETMVCRAIEVLSILSCTGITIFCLSQLV